MKKNITFIVSFISILSISFIGAEQVEVFLNATDGGNRILKVDKNARELTFAQSDLTGYTISGIQNLDLLPCLESVELINITGISDYSFLQQVAQLRRLHMGGCVLGDLRFLEGMVNLEYV